MATDYEKKYNEALERAKKMMESKRKVVVEKQALETIFPELAESEDERIKKIITDSVFYQYGAGVEYKDVLDYLDKLEKQKDFTTENIYKHSRERMSFWNGQQKEQKHEESISQLTVQGKGVYKICPRCKERMIRDDSMVYTSMPPQYRYECPKCGESECDTVMYDNPEMEEQKPADLSDMMVHKEPYIAPVPTPMVADEQKPSIFPPGLGEVHWNPIPSGKDVHKWNLPEDFEEAVYKVANFISPFDSQDELRRVSHRFAEQLMSLAKKELVEKPAEWSEEDKRAIDRACVALRAYANGDLPEFLPSELIGYADRLQSLRPQPKQEWSEEDERNRDRAIFYTRFYQRNEGTTKGSEECIDWLKSLRPSWKPSEEHLEALLNTLHPDDPYYSDLKSLYEQLKKL